MKTIDKNAKITVFQWSDGSVNKFLSENTHIEDFIKWKKQKNPNIRIVCRYSTTLKEFREENKKA